VFNIIIGQVTYGFDCVFNSDKASVTIPPLETIIKDLSTEECKVRLDIFGENYYMCPFTETAKLVIPVQVSVSVEEDKPINVEVKATIEESKKEIKPVEQIMLETVKEQAVQEPVITESKPESENVDFLISSLLKNYKKPGISK
jgi:hypothetical protein